MSRHAQRKSAASKKRFIEKIDGIKGYVNKEMECDQDQLRKTNRLQEEFETRISTFLKDWSNW